MGNKQSAERKDSKDEGNSHSADGKDSGLLKDEVHDANINLLLLGRTGTGKSTTGNNILQSESFNTGDSDTLVTTKCQFAYSQYNGTNIKVVDMPGLGDNSKNEDENLKLVIEAAKEAFEVTPDGFDALLVFTEFGRQSREHRAAVDQLKVIFGQDIFNQYGILAVTYGDNFKRRKDSTQTFEQICSQQKGQLNDFWKECNKRAVLFDNVTPEEMEAQRMTLFDLVKRMRITRRYTREMFEATEAKRDKLIKQAEQFVLTEAIRKELRVIMHDLKGTDVNNFEESTEKLMEIRGRIAAKIENISSLPESVRGLKKIMKFSQSLETAIEMKQKLVRVVRGMTAEENIEDIKRKMADKESQLEEEYLNIIREKAQKGDLGIVICLIPLCAFAGNLGYNAGGIPGCVVFLGSTAAIIFALFVAKGHYFLSVFERLKRWFRSF